MKRRAMKRSAAAATLAALTCIAATVSTAAAATAPPPLPAPLSRDGTNVWSFRVTLDGEPIGEHRFVVRSQGGRWSVTSEARFEVRILGIRAYRYRHEARESWQNGCLRSLESTTDDDGRPQQVQRRFDAGCTFSFAYWNPAMLAQSQLVNAQTGRAEEVSVARLGEARLDVRGAEVNAVRWRIDGPQPPLEVWYSPQGEWLGLDSTVAGGRKLSYRLQPNSPTRKDGE